MKHELANIYRDLAAGKLSQRQALDQIKALKQPKTTDRIGTLLAAAQWERCELDQPAGGEAPHYGRHQILLCGLPHVVASELETLVPSSQCSVVPPGAESVADAYEAAAIALFETIRDLLTGKSDGASLVQLVVAHSDSARTMAGLCGLIETAVLENPALAGQIVFVRPGIPGSDLARRLRAERASSRDLVVRYGADGRLALRWHVADDAPLSGQSSYAFKENGVYLITGGLGGLGILMAREILERVPSARLVLTGRARPQGKKLTALESLQSAGQVTYRETDVGDAAQVGHLLAWCTKQFGLLSGIIHSAGVVRDDFILKKTALQFSEVLRPKVAGSDNLDLASAGMDLDFFILFSSIAAWAGNVGQADYAAANGFMDQFAGYRNALVAAGERKGRTLAIAWPHWIDGGMHIDAASMDMLEKRTGLRSLDTAGAMAALQRCLALPHDRLMVMRGDTAVMRRALGHERKLVAAAPTPLDPAAAAGLTGAASEFLRKEFSTVLKIALHKIDTRAALENYGIDSILAMNLTTQLEKSFGALPKTLFFEYQTIDELTEYFVRHHAEKLGGLVGAAKPSTPLAPVAPVVQTGASRRQRRPAVQAAAQAQAPANEAIAIVGLSGRFPESRDLDAFWRNLRDGKDCIVEVPKERWDWNQYYSEDRTVQGAHFSKWGGFIDGVDEFDPRFFNIAPREAHTIDPQERLFLQHAWMAVEDAGYTRASLQIPHEGALAGQVGVYAGVMYGEYNLSGSLASIANRVSYFLNLHGPSLTLDTMCSSSLTAMHLACQDLRAGRTSLALAGGVNVSIHPNKYAMLSGGQFISGDGHCQSFGEGGDGYIPGEGVGIAVLKRLSDAQHDGNHIYGVIRGSALNHGGKTNGYTVPNPKAQAEVIRRALVEAGIDPRHVSYIEAHGTGTKLGDPIEIAALTKAFYGDAVAQESGYCMIGSAKSNIGHCESAAGIAGVAKVLLQMKHKVIVPSLHSARLNPHIDFGKTPFVVNQSLRSWDQPLVGGQRQPRIAGISSFGAGGANAHLIIEEYNAPAAAAAPLGEQLIFPFSARTPEQLEQRVRDLLGFMARSEQAIDLRSMAHTLQLGREAMDERVALLAVSIEDLGAKLSAFLEERAGADCYRGQVKQFKDELSELMAGPQFSGSVEQMISQGERSKLAALWAKGYELDWTRLATKGVAARLMSLPAYPFANERYWSDPIAVGAKAAVLHPLVHTNTSSLAEPGYASRFKGSEPFLHESGAAGRKALPGLLALEMMRAAVELATPQRAQTGIWEIHATSWGTTMFVDGGSQFGIALIPRADEAVDVEIYSAGAGGSTVHVQSHAVVSHMPAPQRLDIAQIKSGLQTGQTVAPLNQADSGNKFGLSPELLDQVARLLGEVTHVSAPVSLDKVRFVFPCPRNALVWLRHSSTGAVDIDICDEHGNVCVQMTGLRCESAVAITAPVQAAPVVEVSAVVQPAVKRVPREIVLAQASVTTFAPVSKKPDAVRLLPSAQVESQSAQPKATVALMPLAAPSADQALGQVRLFDLGEGVFSIRFENGNLDAAIASLVAALDRVRAEGSCKVVLLEGSESWRGDRNACNQAVERGLFTAVTGFPCPVIAVLGAGAIGAGLLLAAACDFIVCSEAAQYGFTDAAAGLFPSDAEDSFFRERLGQVVADSLLYRATLCSGRDLKDMGWACRIVPAAQVSADAMQFADELARKPQLALGLLKTHLARHLAPLVQALCHVDSLSADGGEAVLVVSLDSLDEAAEQARDDASIKCIVVEWTSSQEGQTPGAAAFFLALVRQAPVPVIAAVASDAVGLEWLLALACDAAVYSDGGSYAASALWADPALMREATVLSAQRLGASLGQEACLTLSRYTGAQLKSKHGSLTVVEQSAVMSEARRLAALWSAWPRAAIGAWKRGRDAQFEELVAALPVAPVQTAPVGEATLTSDVVSLTAHPDGVVVIGMHDRAAKNMFSEALVSGLKQAFAHIANCSAYKAVVLTGFDSYFATGGTMETLLAIQQGQAQFTDEKVFQLPMECPLPVIAAIQGHGIGGGWSFGMFCDLVVLSKESRYLSPYMGYGFTPGAGATLVFPEKIGYDLARETLLTAREVSGQELARRGVLLPVLARRDVVSAAVAMASGMAQLPRAQLVALKQLWSHGLRQKRDDAYHREVAMHEQTFVMNTTTRETIEAKFAPEAVQPKAPAAKPAVVALSASIIGKLKTLLAQELLLKAEEIDEDAQFIDLGLDSITGVTWIRLINAHYGIDIEATKVYSHPTLTQLARLVASEAAATETAVPVPAVVKNAPVPERVVTSSDGDRLSAIVRKLGTMLASELLLRPEEIEDTMQFIDMGLDSITGVTWVRKINEHYGTQIEATKVYSNPTLQQMGRLVMLEAKLAPAAPIAAVPPAPEAARAALTSWRGQGRNAAKAPSSSSGPIAVIGIAGQFPKADNLDQFWTNLAEGRNCVTEVSAERWNLADYFQAGAPTAGKTNSKWLGALDGFDLFDPLFFNISPTEAESMDPQQRLFLQACWHGIENAGYNPQSLSGSQTGVFVGCGPSDYHQPSREQQLSAQGFTGAATSILAARISYFLNLHGPCISVDTACSSSLVAIANACDSLNNGNSDLALAGGVYVMAGPAMHIMTSQAGMLSTDGRCYSFDQRANGFVPGEGVGVLVLKRLADAERDQDRIQAVIEGWGVNQDGRTNGITAPNEEAQTRLLQSVYRKFDIDPAAIGLIEAHGTGTKLGDPIEVAGLKGAFKPFTKKAGYCALGSVKSNIGHCLTAAGAAGFIKLVLALKHRTLPPTANFSRHNEHISLDGSPFYVNDALKPWSVAAGQQRRAAISSFGFSGTNAHLVVAEHAGQAQHRPDVSVVTEDGRMAMPLSARTEAQLRAAAQNLLAHIRANGNALDLPDLAYTLQAGRDHMGERVAFLVRTVDELAVALQAFLAGESDSELFWQGQVKRHKEAIKLIAQDDDMKATITGKWMAERKLGKLLEWYVKGLDIDWTLLYGPSKPRRIELPNYPFAKESYRLPLTLPTNAVAPGRVTPETPAARSVQNDQVSYSHEWVEQRLTASTGARSHKTVLVVRTAPAFGLETAISSHYAADGACRVLHVIVNDSSSVLGADQLTCGRDDLDGFAHCLRDVARIDALYFLACSEVEDDVLSADLLRAGQDSNEIQLLRLVKALKQGGKIDGKIDTYILTVDNHPFGGQNNRYWGAGASGLAYSLAQGNHQFRVRNLDLSSRDLDDIRDRMPLLAAITGEPASDRGEVVKLAQGKRYRQSFLRLDWDKSAPSAIRHGGVYLIAGGSGIVGRIITRKLIDKYSASVIWLGRSAAGSEKIGQALRSFADAGDKLQYLQADVLDEQAVRLAVAQIRQRHGRIDGAVFSGMVFGTENSIDQTTEAGFRSILEVKTLGSQAFYAALRDEALDFMCFFSSGQAYSFSGAAKLAAYATGITFGDSFVRSVQVDSRFPVGTINWGFWQAAVTQRIEKLEGVSLRSLDALADDEGFACFEHFVGELQRGRMHQVLCMRASPEVEALMNCSQDHYLALAGDSAASAVSLAEDAIAVSHERISALIDAKQRSGLNSWFARLLFCQLDQMIELAGIRLPQSVDEIRGRCAITAKYSPWLRQSFDLLAGEGLVAVDGDEIGAWNAPDRAATWAGWNVHKEACLRDKDTHALVVLIDDCVQNLPGILQGHILATDVIFPNSSMDRVAGLYRSNATADTFNQIVAATVVSYLEQRLLRDPQARVRILEVGAGTGGTSAIVLSKLGRFKKSIDEYCYTDLSKAFFFHAEKNYLPDNPFIVCRRLDIEQPIEAQGFEIGSYDLVISTNALHATRDIRATLRHAKAALRKDGFIVVSEMCDSSLSTHLTFGLLDGWWLFEDAALRIPGCPGLYPHTWQRVLEEEGFGSVLLPGSDAQPLGSQVVVARSDGVVRLDLGTAPQPVVPAPAKPAARVSPAQPVADVSGHVRDGIFACLSATLKIPVDSIEPDVAFSDYGIDSILGVNFIEQVNQRFSIALNTAVIFEYSSIERLSAHIVQSCGAQIQAGGVPKAVDDEPRAVAPVAAEPARLPALHQHVDSASAVPDIAIIGMSGQFPMAGNVEQFWQNLIDGVDGVQELPAHYLNQDRAWTDVKQKGKSRCKWAGILADRDCFDPLFFSISPKEAESMNPHQRLVMQESWNALEDAGYDPKSLSGSQTAIFIGAEPAGYIGDSFTGLSDAIIASRLSYALNFNGPAFVVNTGCSSSAVAIHLGCESLRNRESSLVLAGGVNACLHQDVMVRLDQIDMLSPSGRCYTFDRAGDGTIISEGVGMIVLKRLDEAVAAGDPIYATIRGSGINQDGASNGITAPNGAAQEQLIVSVYERFGINPEQISYVEAHGTGTKLGDPVETNALVRAFRRYSERTHWCAVGSAKSHIGHAAAAAGVIGVIKVLLSMRHRQLPKLLNFSEINPLIQFSGSPFHITTEATEWRAPANVPRMAALNSFGHSGTNAHLVIGEYLPQALQRTPVVRAERELAMPLSAKTPEQLRQKCEELLAFLLADAGSIDVISLAYTLQVGRESMDERLGIAADSVAALARKLRRHLDGAVEAGVWRGQAKRTGALIAPDGTEPAAQLLERWTQGRSIDWQRLWTHGELPVRMRLPRYPFAKERYWLDSALGGGHTHPVASESAGTESIEDILDRIADDSLAADDAVKLLKAIV